MTRNRVTPARSSKAGTTPIHKKLPGLGSPPDGGALPKDGNGVGVAITGVLVGSIVGAGVGVGVDSMGEGGISSSMYCMMNNRLCGFEGSSASVRINSLPARMMG
jgi:hypothetical protein